MSLRFVGETGPPNDTLYEDISQKAQDSGSDIWV